MAYTQADLDAVRKARLNGARTVRSGDKEITYRSDQELAALEQAIKYDLAQQVAVAGVGQPIARQVYVTQRSRGY